ncbi:hypothetical protein ABH931_006132 [Streptacidiphilus sp. MAP12-33]|uniref:DUF6221 family protein n=1 Tax=Streptacidiphilus sp. MAP12-33 TaxID=3156266 RepID=UPI003519B5B8
MDIADFLRARLDEDEQRARAAADDSGNSWIDTGESVYVKDSNDPVAVGPWASYLPDGVRSHIARWDPARVLTEIAAKRRVLARHRDYDFPSNEDDGPGDYAWTPSCDHCFKPWPCPDMLDVAAPYREHPGYQPEWAPES